MEKTIQPFQYIAVKEAYEEGRFLIADDMGLFKTAGSILLNNKIRGSNPRARTLVVCPTSVKEHWANEIQGFAYPKGQEINVLDTRNFGSNISKVRRSEWTVLHYHLLSSLDGDALKPLYDAGFDHVILDEVHNARNPEAIRTQSVRRLIEKPDHVTLLSGTPIPNTVEDIYMLMHALEPGKYPLSDDRKMNAELRRRFRNLYRENPQAFKELMQRKMIRRLARDYIGHRVPEVEEKNVLIPIRGDSLDIYNSILMTELPLGMKLMQLEKALLDTDLLDPSISLGSPSSPKYDALDMIVRREARNGKLLIFTNLKVGVVDKLVARYAQYGAISITGDVPSYGQSKREVLRKQFQHDPDTRILIATTAMNEGVDLTAATAIVNLMLPWTPAEYQQRRKRSERIGEVEKERVVVYNLIGKYPGRRKSLDEARRDMLEAKQRVVDYLLSGIQISKEEMQNLQVPTRVPSIRRAIETDNQKILKFYLRWRGAGTKIAQRRLKKMREAGREIANLYPKCNMAKNSADLYRPIIDDLQPEEPWLDLAGGPGMLGYHTGKPVHVLDIDFNHLRKGKEIVTGSHVNGSFSSIPYRDGVFGLSVCSLAFQMSEPSEERAQVLQEMNRVMKPGGYGIITIPARYMTPEDREHFRDSLIAYGFEPLDKYHGVDLGPSRIEIYALIKVGEADPEIRDLTFKGDKWVKR